MALPVIGAVLGILANGVSAYLQQKQVSDAQKNQAKALQRAINDIQREIDRNSINEQEALKRLHTVYSKLKPQLREIMNKRIDEAMRQIQQEYKTTMQNIRTQYTQRRLPVGAIANKMFTKGAEQIKNLTERLNTQQQEQEANLTLDEYTKGEIIRDKYKQYYDSLLSNLWQLRAGTYQPKPISPAVMGIAGALSYTPKLFGVIPTSKTTSQEKKLD